jgi:hypothetical protein
MFVMVLLAAGTMSALLVPGCLRCSLYRKRRLLR